MSRRPDVVVIGAGIVGAACAAELARAGFLVTILEQGPVGGGATAEGMGHIVVMDDSEDQFALTAYSQKLWDELALTLPEDAEFDRTGTIWVAADEEEMEEVHRKHRYYTERGAKTEVLSARQLRAREPNLRQDLAGGLLVPGDSIVYPPKVAQVLVKRAIGHGARFIQGQRVAAVADRAVLLADGARIKAGFVVNAAGAGAVHLLPGLEMQPRKGHLVITGRYPGFVRHQLVELGYLKSAHATKADSVAFNVQPRKTGQILIGSSRQFGQTDRQIDYLILERMVQRALAYMPGLEPLTAIRAWTGFRAATPDKMPLIGPVPHQPWHILATGHEGLGITTALATAGLLAHLLTGSPTPIPIAPFLPHRFLAETGRQSSPVEAAKHD